uniref:Uncharacterized protein n=1 Tax=Anguilla anguilla TaxID=7936 RepID=A0A0E9PSV6_ANGAN
MVKKCNTICGVKYGYSSSRQRHGLMRDCAIRTVQHRSCTSC